MADDDLLTPAPTTDDDPAPAPAETPGPLESHAPVPAPAAPTAPRLSAEGAPLDEHGWVINGPVGAPPDPNRSLTGDIWQLFQQSAYSTIAAAAGAVEYEAGTGGRATGVREWASDRAQAAGEPISPQMRAALERRFIPSREENPDTPTAWGSFGDFFGALGAQAVSSIGSLIGTLPAVVVGSLAGPQGAAAGAATGALTSAGLGMGTVFSDTMDAVRRMPEERLREVNEAYRELRDQGVDRASAINEVVRGQLGHNPELAAAIAALTGGVAGRFAGRIGARTNQGGVIRSAGQGVIHEAPGEFIEEASQARLSGTAVEGITGQPHTWADTAEAGVRGMIGGGALGAGTGAVGGVFARGAPETAVPALVPATTPYIHPAVTAPAAAPAPGQGQVDPSLTAALDAAAPPPATGTTTTPPGAPAGTPPTGASPAGSPAGSPSVPGGPSNVPDPLGALDWAARQAAPDRAADADRAAGIDPSVGAAAAAAAPAPATTATASAAGTPAVNRNEPVTAPAAPVADLAANTVTPTPAPPAPPQPPPPPTPEQRRDAMAQQREANAQRREATAQLLNSIREASGAAELAGHKRLTPGFHDFRQGFVAGKIEGRPLPANPTPAMQQGFDAARGAPPTIAPPVPATEQVVPVPPAPAGAPAVQLAPAPTPSAQETAAQQAETRTETEAVKETLAEAPTREDTSAPAPVLKRVQSARRTAKGGLLAGLQRTLEARLGEHAPARGDSDAIVESILDQAERELSAQPDADQKSVSEALTFINKRAAALAKERVEQEVEARTPKDEEADTEEEGTEEEVAERERSSRGLVADAINKEPGAIRQIIDHIGGMPADKLGDFYRKQVKPAVDAHVAAGGTEPVWAESLRTVTESGKRGGGVKQRAERAAAVATWREKFVETGRTIAKEERATQSEAQRDSARQVENIFDGVKVDWNKATTGDAVKRLTGLQAEVTKLLGKGDLKARIAKVGNDPRAAAILTMLNRAKTLTSATPDNVVRDYVAVELMLRADMDPASVLDILRTTAEIETGGIGTMGMEGDQDIADEDAIPDTETTKEEAATGRQRDSEEASEEEVAAAVETLDVLETKAEAMLPISQASLRAAVESGDATAEDVEAFRTQRGRTTGVTPGSSGRTTRLDDAAEKVGRTKNTNTLVLSLKKATNTVINAIARASPTGSAVHRAAQALMQMHPAGVLYADNATFDANMFPSRAGIAALMSDQRKPTGAFQRTVGAEIRAEEQFDELGAAIHGGQSLLDKVAGPLTRGLWGVLKERVGNTPVFVYSDADWKKAFGDTRAAGLFIANTPENVKNGELAGVIALPQSLLESPMSPFQGVANLREAAMHELTHAGTFASIATDTKHRQQVEGLMAIVRNHHEKLGTKMSGELAYALSDPFEFLAMGLNSNEVRGALLATPVNAAQRKSLGLRGIISDAYAAFKDMMSQFLGASRMYDNALAAAIEISEMAIQSPGEQTLSLRDMTNPVRLDATGAKADTEWQANAMARLSGTTSSIGSALGGLTAPAESRWTDTKQWLKNVGLGFSTSRQIEEYLKPLFARDRRMDMIDPTSKVDPVTQAITAHNQRRQIAEDNLKKFLPAIRQLDQLPPTQQQQVSSLLVEGSVANAHPDVPVNATGKNKHLMGSRIQQVQARAWHKDLHARYNALSKDQKAAYHATIDVLKQAHTDIVNSLRADVVDRWWIGAVDANIRDPAKNPLPIAHADIAGLKQRVELRKLTPADETALGEETTKMLAKIDRRARMDGPYVPLQRFGDFVVRWKENAPDTVTYATRAEADAHAEKSPYKALSVTEKHYDKAGAEITQADPALESAEIAKELAMLPHTATPIDKLQATNKGKKTAKAATIKRDSVRSEFVVEQQVQGVSFFERRSEAENFHRELNERGVRDLREVDLRTQPSERRGLINDADLDKVVAHIERDPSLSQATKNNMVEKMQEMWLLISPNRTLESSLVKRRNVLGASRDMKRVVANYGVAASNFVAGIKTNLPITTALKTMNDQRNALSKVTSGADSGDTLARAAGLREIETRLLDKPVDAGGRGSAIPLVRKVQSLAFTYFLASPSYSMVQMTQPWLLSAPVLSARYGAGRGVRALSKAMYDIGMGKVLGQGAKDTARALKTLVSGTESGTPSPTLDIVKRELAKQPDGKQLGQMLDTLASEGLVDGDAGLEIVRAELSEDGYLGRKLGQTELLARAMPSAIEVINRASTAVATYRLARRTGKTHDEATAEARKVVDMTQADYSSSNTARLMDPRRHPWTAPMMTFRKYAQAIYSLVIRQAYLAVKGKSKQERRQAFRTLAYTLGAHMTVAGALGLPTEMFGVLMGAAALLFGEDEPWDWEKELRQAAAEALGPEAAEILMRGLPRAAGVDLAGRLGLNSLIFTQDLRDFEKRTMLGYAGNILLGAPGNMVSNMMSVPGLAADGDYSKALEAMLPKGLRDVLRAARIGDEGLQTRRGERFDAGRDATTAESVIQALGFTPSAQSEAYEARDAIQGANRRINRERSELMREWRQAEPAERADHWQAIRDWNQSQDRRVRISRENLLASQREAQRRDRAARGQVGGYLSRNREFLRQEGSFAVAR